MNNITASTTPTTLQSAIMGLQKAAYAKILDNEGLIFNANALRNVNQQGEVLANPVNGFEAALNTATGQTDIISKLRSFGMPVNVKDTPKKSKSIGPNGITIAPNIIKKMEQDEEYAQEIMDEISNFLYNVLPAAERDYAMQGARVKWFGISIDSGGQIKSWTGGVHIDVEEEYHGGLELAIFFANGEKVDEVEIDSDMYISHSNEEFDWLAYLSLVGDTNRKTSRTYARI